MGGGRAARIPAGSTADANIVRSQRGAMNRLATISSELGRYALLLFLILPLAHRFFRLPPDLVNVGGWVALSASIIAQLSGLLGLRSPRTLGGRSACWWGIGFSSVVVAFNVFVGFIVLCSNERKYHAIGHYTPESVHDGTWTVLQRRRQRSLDTAAARHPRRFTRPPRKPHVATPSWINKPDHLSHTA